jgi:hypothetical protein
MLNGNKWRKEERTRDEDYDNKGSETEETRMRTSPSPIEDDVRQFEAPFCATAGSTLR